MIIAINNLLVLALIWNKDPSLQFSASYGYCLHYRGHIGRNSIYLSVTDYHQTFGLMEQPVRIIKHCSNVVLKVNDVEYGW